MAIYYGMLLSISSPDRFIYQSRQASCLRFLIHLEFEGGEVGFVDFAEAEAEVIGDEAFTSFDFDIIAYGALPAKNSSPSCQQ